jgi:hypothetical protein
VQKTTAAAEELTAFLDLFGPFWTFLDLSGPFWTLLTCGCRACAAVCGSAWLQGHHEHEAYMGDRTKESLESFADSLVPSAGQPHLRHGQLKAAPRTPGCNVAGQWQIDGVGRSVGSCAVVTTVCGTVLLRALLPRE